MTLTRRRGDERVDGGSEMANAQSLSAVQALTTIALDGLLGTIGQGTRAVVGMKKINDIRDDVVSENDLYSASRLVVSLMIGFVAGVVATFSIGLSKLASFDGDINLLVGIAAAGYVGSDFIEAFATTLGATRPPIDASLDDIPITPLPQPVPAPAPVPTGPEATISGRISIFGGPDDPGVGRDEGLALLEESDLADYPGLFLPEQPAGTTGLARRLNPDANYIACRWNYDETPREHLRRITVRVVNPTTGASEVAQPVDWGPGEKSGRVADLSPGLARRLGVVTDQTCRVLVPLPMKSARSFPAPSPAQHPKVLSVAEIEGIFGAFKYREAAKRGAIEIIGDWPKENIVSIAVPELAVLIKDELECHRLIAAPLAAAFKEVARNGLIDRVLHFDGLWVPRHKSWNPARSLSAHSWGIAFDINARWNGYGCAPAPKGAAGCVVELVPIFESFGFAWGGRFRPDSARDGMHFEYCLPPQTPKSEP